MRKPLLLMLIGGLLPVGIAAAQTPSPAVLPKAVFANFIIDDPRVPSDIKAEFLPDSGTSGASCRLVEWVLSSSSHAPAPALEFAESLKDVCSLPVADLDVAAARERLGSQMLAMQVNGNTFTLLARSSKAEPPNACCSLQGPMHRLGETDLWALRYRLADLDHAMLTFVPEGAQHPEQNLAFRGPHAPAEPKLQSHLTGRLTEDSLYSSALGETRKLLIYVPGGEPPPGGWPALFVADGDAVWHDAMIVEAMVKGGTLSPIVLVGTLSGQQGIVEDRSALGIADLRSADYLQEHPGTEDRFSRHMTFLSSELVAFAHAKYGVTADPKKIAIAGFSNGGQLAFEAGVLHPEVFGSAIAMSAGWKPLEAKDLTGARRARFYASAGIYEDPFLRSTSYSAQALKAAGYEVQFTRYAAGHMTDQWDVALADALPRIFAPGTATGPALAIH